MSPFCDPPSDEQTAAGHEERRIVRYVTVESFEAWRNRATVAFVLLTLISTGAGWLAYRAGQHDQDNLQAAGRDATTKSCLSGVDLRIATAAGLDDLRRLAITNAPTKRGEAFITLTQPSIDRLLSQAAGREYHAPLPPGTVSAAVADRVRELGAGKCEARTDDAFEDSTHSG